MSPVEQLRSALSALPGVVCGASHFGARGRDRAWSVAGCEFAHLHADDRIDLRLPPSVQATLRADPRAHFRNSRSAWLELEFQTTADLDHVLALAQDAWTACRQP